MEPELVGEWMLKCVDSKWMDPGEIVWWRDFPSDTSLSLFLRFLSIFQSSLHYLRVSKPCSLHLVLSSVHLNKDSTGQLAEDPHCCLLTSQCRGIPAEGTRCGRLDPIGALRIIRPVSARWKMSFADDHESNWVVLHCVLEFFVSQHSQHEFRLIFPWYLSHSLSLWLCFRMYQTSSVPSLPISTYEAVATLPLKCSYVGECSNCWVLMPLLLARFTFSLVPPSSNFRTPKALVSMSKLRP